MDFNFENELTGKITLVTGGSKGAGKAIADRLLKTGATVIITARNKPEDESNGVHFISADLSKPEGARKVVEEIHHQFGRLDILVNNMGGSETPGGVATGSGRACRLPGFTQGGLPHRHRICDRRRDNSHELGTFSGSPAIMQYHLGLGGTFISSLRITG